MSTKYEGAESTRRCTMNIKDLREVISDLPDDMEIGGFGHFGELLEVYEIRVGEVDSGFPKYNSQTVLIIDIEDAGEEPD